MFMQDPAVFKSEQKYFYIDAKGIMTERKNKSAAF